MTRWSANSAERTSVYSRSKRWGWWQKEVESWVRRLLEIGRPSIPSLSLRTWHPCVESRCRSAPPSRASAGEVHHRGVETPHRRVGTLELPIARAKSTVRFPGLPPEPIPPAIAGANAQTVPRCRPPRLTRRPAAGTARAVAPRVTSQTRWSASAHRNPSPRFAHSVSGRGAPTSASFLIANPCSIAAARSTVL
jgi:hypothetical protein